MNPLGGEGVRRARVCARAWPPPIPTELDSVSWLDRVRTSTHRVALAEPASPDDDIPDRTERGRAADSSLLDQPLDAGGP